MIRILGFKKKAKQRKQTQAPKISFVVVFWWLLFAVAFQWLQPRKTQHSLREYCHIRFTFQRHDKNCGREKSGRRRRSTSSERCVADTLKNRSLSSPTSYVTRILGFVLCHTINDHGIETKKNEKLQMKFFLRKLQKHRLSKFEESFLLNFFLTVVACASCRRSPFVELLMMHLCIKALHYLWNFIFFFLFQDTELLVLGCLKWDVSCVTPLDFIELIISRLPINNDNCRDIDPEKIRKHAQAFISLAVRGESRFESRNYFGA